MGRTARAFFPTGSKGKQSSKKAKSNADQSFSQLVDLFLTEYGWTIPQLLELTWYQLSTLSKVIQSRRYERNHTLGNIIRVAQHGKESQYKSFMKSLKPKEQRKRKKSTKETNKNEELAPDSRLTESGLKFGK